MDQEQAFFDRELKYRHWFLLPPYARVWRLELKQDDLRSLAGRMRDLYRQWKETLHIRRAYLTSRRKIRNSYRGVLELHCQTQELIRSGLPQQPHTILSPLEDQAEPLPKRFSSATL